MLQNKYSILIVFILASLTSCIEEFKDDILYNYVGDISVSGWITDMLGEQVISLSVSTHYTLRYPDPLANCHVEVRDDQGNYFIYAEKSRGIYVYNYSEGDVIIGRAYKLVFVTPIGKVYESEYEILNPVPEIERFHYGYEMQESKEKDFFVPGLRFYADFSSEEGYTNYFKLDIWETYGFKSAFDEVYWVKYGSFGTVPEENINSFCYITEKVPDILLISTKNLAEKKIPDFPLNFVSNQTQRLMHGYSPELRLMSLSPIAHNYWKNQEQKLEESGGLFETQPPADFGNIACVDDPEEKVLGYFGASAVSSKRIFLRPGYEFEFNIEPYCIPSEVRGTMWDRIYRDYRNIYYFVYYAGYMGNVSLHMVSKPCFDCTLLFGSTKIKPEFWLD